MEQTGMFSFAAVVIKEH